MLEFRATLHNHGFKRYGRVVIYRQHGEEPEKLGSIDLERGEFVSEWQAKLTDYELAGISDYMKARTNGT